MQTRIPQPATALPAPTMVVRPAPGLHAAFEAIVEQCLAYWRTFEEAQRARRARASFEEMDSHMLRDIGASESLIAQAVERSEDYRRRIGNVFPS